MDINILTNKILLCYYNKIEKKYTCKLKTNI